MSENYVSELAGEISDGAAPAVNFDDVNNSDVVQPNAAEAQQASEQPGNVLAEGIRFLTIRDQQHTAAGMISV